MHRMYTSEHPSILFLFFRAFPIIFPTGSHVPGWRDRSTSRRLPILTAAVLALASCAGGDGAPTSLTPVGAPAELDVASTWQWQLQGEVNTSSDVDVYDLDLFDTPADLVAGLRREGWLVVCYFSAGSHESWRPDASDDDPDDLGAPLDGFADERWLDTRSTTVRAVVVQRLDRAVCADSRSKGLRTLILPLDLDDSFRISCDE